MVELVMPAREVVGWGRMVLPRLPRFWRIRDAGPFAASRTCSRAGRTGRGVGSLQEPRYRGFPVVLLQDQSAAAPGHSGERSLGPCRSATPTAQTMARIASTGTLA